MLRLRLWAVSEPPLAMHVAVLAGQVCGDVCVCVLSDYGSVGGRRMGTAVLTCAEQQSYLHWE